MSSRAGMLSLVTISVIRLADFLRFSATNLRTKISKILVTVWGYIEKHHFQVNIAVATFGQLLETFGQIS